MNDVQREELKHICPSILFDVDMGSYSTFKTGGAAEAVVDVYSKKELKNIFSWFQNNKSTWKMLGGGSNILIASKQFKGVFIRLKGDFSLIEEVECQEDFRCLEVGGGTSLAKTVSYCVDNSLTGLEWAVGIPGSVGGAVRMNAGAWGTAMADCLVSVTLANNNGDIFECLAEDIDFRYRKTVFKGESEGARYGVINAVIKLSAGKYEIIKEQCRSLGRQRKGKQPAGVASAGSFFKNPEGHPAGRLIEKAGLKGITHGGAKVSEVHANFIINTGGATPDDILKLMKLVQDKVYKDSGVFLEPEVHII